MKITLRACRVNAGLTLREASDFLNVHNQTLSKYERDSSNIPIGLLKNMSELYQIPIENIFLGEEHELRNKTNNKG